VNAPKQKEEMPPFFVPRRFVYIVDILYEILRNFKRGTKFGVRRIFVGIESLPHASNAVKLCEIFL